MFKTVYAQERARAKRKAIFELRAATNEEDSPSICVVAAPKEHGHLPQLLTTLGRRYTEKELL